MWFLVTIGAVLAVLLAVLVVQQLRHGQARSRNIPIDRHERLFQHRAQTRAWKRTPGYRDW